MTSLVIPGMELDPLALSFAYAALGCITLGILLTKRLDGESIGSRIFTVLFFYGGIVPS